VIGPAIDDLLLKSVMADRCQAGPSRSLSALITPSSVDFSPRFVRRPRLRGKENRAGFVETKSEIVVAGELAPPGKAGLCRPCAPGDRVRQVFHAGCRGGLRARWIWQAQLTPAAESAVHRDDIGVAHFWRLSAREPAVAAAAVANDARAHVLGCAAQCRAR